MIAAVFAHLRAWLHLAADSIGQRASTVLSLFLVAALGLVLWHVWAFTVAPALHPEKPRYLPYWTPYLGHMIPFFRDSHRLISYGRKYFANSREPFVLKVAGEELVVVMAPQDVAEVFKHSGTLSFDGLIRSLHRGVANVSEAAYKTLWRTPAQGFESLYPNPKQQVLVHTGTELLHKQLLNGQPLEDLTRRFLGYAETRTRSDQFSKDCILASSGVERVVSLHHWALDVFVEAATAAFFGESLQAILPSISQVFDQWDMNSWMTTYQYPAVFAKAATEPRDEIVKAITQYLGLPKEERSDASPCVLELEDEQRHAGLSDVDSAKIFMITYWAINTNAQKCVFWLLVHLLRQPSLVASLRKETEPAIIWKASKERTASTPLEVNHRYLLESCPLLNAAFNETLRTSSSSTNLREVLAPVQIGGKTISSGAKIYIPHRQLLLDEEGFGLDTLEWKPERWLENEGLERNGFYRPFGGGSTLCSGRFLARREVIGFVAIVLARYDLEIVAPDREVLGVHGKPAPQADLGKPSLGVNLQMPGDDLILKVTERNLGS